MQITNKEHDIYAAFTQGNSEGCIYLETTISGKTMELLHIIPGILHMNRRNVISIENGSTSLRLPQKGNKNLKAGQ